MSSDDDSSETEAADFCASCGSAEVDDIKLKPCDGCDLVNYCSDDCQNNHKSEHEAACKERAAELRDDILFKQPESTHIGDCPICCVPLPIQTDKNESMFYSCCCKLICKGCAYANKLFQHQDNMPETCPFCRHPVPKTREEFKKNLMKRIEANDQVALSQMGGKHFDEGDYDGAFKYLKKAADLGNADAHYQLSLLYLKGTVVEKDEKKELYHLEEAAIAGHPRARYNLGCYELRSGSIERADNIGYYEVRANRFERAVKHFSIAANLGHDGSLKALKEYYKPGLLSKDCFAAALRGHYAAVKATKSPQRETAAKYFAE